MQIILDVMVDNTWQRAWNVGLLDSTLTRQLDIDYIRVFQQRSRRRSAMPQQHPTMQQKRPTTGRPVPRMLRRDGGRERAWNVGRYRRART